MHGTIRPLVPTRERYAGALLGAFVADSLAMAPHWIYDPAKIVEQFGRVTDLQAPPADGYHSGKSLGAQTHYGDQGLVLAESLEACDENFVVDDFVHRWQEFWAGSTSYRDHATKDTLARLDAHGREGHSGSDSDELGGAARIAPLLVVLRGEEQPTIIAAARAQTAVTHADPDVLDAAEFIARLVFLLVRSVSIPVALEMAAGLDYRHLQPKVALHRAMEWRNRPTPEGVAALGASCPLPKALPSVFLILLQHGESTEHALVENVMAGGDSAARGMMLGTILGAANGSRSIPPRWLGPLLARPRLEQFLRSAGLGG